MYYYIQGQNPDWLPKALPNALENVFILCIEVRVKRL